MDFYYITLNSVSVLVKNGVIYLLIYTLWRLAGTTRRGLLDMFILIIGVIKAFFVTLLYIR